MNGEHERSTTMNEDDSEQNINHKNNTLQISEQTQKKKPHSLLWSSRSESNEIWNSVNLIKSMNLNATEKNPTKSFWLDMDMRFLLFLHIFVMFFSEFRYYEINLHMVRVIYSSFNVHLSLLSDSVRPYSWWSVSAQNVLIRFNFFSGCFFRIRAYVLAAETPKKRPCHRAKYEKRRMLKLAYFCWRDWRPQRLFNQNRCRSSVQCWFGSR